MAMVRDNWRNDRPYPGRLLIGSGQFASGDGYRLAEQAGAAFVRMDHQVTFINGLPDPRTTDGSRALVTQNPAAIWVNADGRRFVNEAASSKVVEAAVFEQDSATHWLVFDERGKKSFGIRDAPWLSPGTVNEEILLNPALTKSANSIEKLAIAAGLPVQALITTVTRFNAQIESGEDRDFQRFGSGTDSKIPAPIGQAPFYAIQLFPTTRKSMGGPAIDLNGHALDTEGQSIPGLYAAGELTGVAGINGSHGGSGTFLGPSLLTGRIAGRTAAADLGLDMPSQAINAPAGETPSTVVPIGRDVLQAMIDTQRPGYWHFEVSHALVLERAYECSRCHDTNSTMTPAISAAQMLARLDTCTTCH
jgi:succinate dehydrogenase/fumarate reductase flavoprotein subunit